MMRSLFAWAARDLPLTLALSPQAGRGDVARARRARAAGRRGSFLLAARGEKVPGRADEGRDAPGKHEGRDAPAGGERRRGILARSALAFFLLLSPLPAFAVNPDEVLSDPALEARARALSAQLRCMVCQNQSIDDSNAELAKDLRVLVRERLANGDSDKAVIDYVVSRYGEFVLLKPRFEPSTLPLWLLTPLLLIGGRVALWGYSRRRSKATPESAEVAGLSADEEARLAKLTGVEPVSGERL